MRMRNHSGPQVPRVAPQVSWTGSLKTLLTSPEPPIITPGNECEGRQVPPRLHDLGLGFRGGEVGRRDRATLGDIFLGCVCMCSLSVVYTMCVPPCGTCVEHV